MSSPRLVISFFFFNDTATTEIYTLSLHDALPISSSGMCCSRLPPNATFSVWAPRQIPRDRKSTRLNSSHTVISYAVFCLKKKKAILQIAGILHDDTHSLAIENFCCGSPRYSACVT